jgi:hypothetical protein
MWAEIQLMVLLMALAMYLEILFGFFGCWDWEIRYHREAAGR